MDLLTVVRDELGSVTELVQAIEQGEAGAEARLAAALDKAAGAVRKAAGIEPVVEPAAVAPVEPAAVAPVEPAAVAPVEPAAVPTTKAVEPTTEESVVAQLVEQKFAELLKQQGQLLARLQTIEKSFAPPQSNPSDVTATVALADKTQWPHDMNEQQPH